MGLDFSLYYGKNCIYSGNITHNVTNMWEAAGVYDALYMSNSEKAETVCDALRSGVIEMATHPTKYRAMNAPNGWGKYEHALMFLCEAMEAVEENPDAVICVNK